MMKRFLFIAIAAISLIACQHDDGEMTPQQNKSVVILFENDVHCGVSEHGYSRIAGLRNAINQSDTAECVIVSSGDYLQGGTWGALSRGEYIVEMMNAVGYKAVTIGNHEFDYGVPRLLELIGKSTNPATCVNFSKTGSTEQYLKPYVMSNISGRRIAFVGVVTPETQESEFYSFYDSEGKLLYDVYEDSYINKVQKAANDARSAGAEYVILLAHLGEEENGFTSQNLIQSTKGIDIVLDAHTHSVIPSTHVTNKEGKDVLVAQTGTQFANIGKLLIDKSGNISTMLLPTAQIDYLDAKVEQTHDRISKLVESVSGEQLGTSAYELSIMGADGNRAVRNAETTIGNFVADAYRYSLSAEIGLANGGGVRKTLPAGVVTYGNLIEVNPFFNDLSVRIVKGSVLRQVLAESYSKVPAENGSFLHVSGLKVKIGGEILVEDKTTGTFAPLDDARTYSVASSSYVFQSFGHFADSQAQPSILMKDAESLKDYFVNALGGVMPEKYSKLEGRIEK